jgi:hypothetical protein
VEELSIENLSAVLRELLRSNKAVKTAELDLYNTRQLCEKNIFGKHGIVEMADRVKNFFGSKFGFNSEAYRAVGKIKFVR